MSVYGIYKCKQCRAVFSSSELGNLPYKTVGELFARTSEANAIRYARITNEMITHRCDPENIGICELIGWRKQE